MKPRLKPALASATALLAVAGLSAALGLHTRVLSVWSVQRETGQPNRLIHEKSPYLLQHAHNPVDWRPWGPEAFEAARGEGYSGGARVALEADRSVAGQTGRSRSRLRIPPTRPHQTLRAPPCLCASVVPLQPPTTLKPPLPPPRPG